MTPSLQEGVFNVMIAPWGYPRQEYTRAVLSIGIVGLPNVGKSTLFNALTAGGAEVSNYPFTTISSNIGVVPVPDPRLDALERVLQPEKKTPCAIRFMDIAGLVEGASRGEGLGNQFLGEIRQVDAIVHVVRCFAKADVAHVFADVDPVRDADVIDAELMLADLEVLERAIEKRKRDWQTHPAAYDNERSQMTAWREALERGEPLRTMNLDQHDLRELRTAGLLTGKPVLYIANVAGAGDETVAALAAREPDSRLLALDAELELELSELDSAERAEFMAELELNESGLDRMVRAAFDLLGLIAFYTVAKNKLQAWEIPRGTAAATAAGKIHSDMERGFIRAKVLAAAELIETGDLHEVQSRGHVRVVGRDHPIEDGDVVEFLFNA
jgi:GTP-binding protein YchF